MFLSLANFKFFIRKYGFKNNWIMYNFLTVLNKKSIALD